MSAFVPKTEDLYSNDPVKVRARAIELCVAVATEVLAEERDGGCSDRCAMSKAERIVPHYEVPRVKRRVALRGDRYAEYHAPMWKVFLSDGTFVDDDASAVHVAWRFETMAANRSVNADALHAELLALKANPDMPADEPAAAHGGAWRGLTWYQMLDVREEISKVAKTNPTILITPAELASLNAKLASLLGAVPVGRALEVPLLTNEIVAKLHGMSAISDDATDDDIRRLVVRVDALRGLAPTVTP